MAFLLNVGRSPFEGSGNDAKYTRQFVGLSVESLRSVFVNFRNWNEKNPKQGKLTFQKETTSLVETGLNKILWHSTVFHRDKLCEGRGSRKAEGFTVA